MDPATTYSFYRWPAQHFETERKADGLFSLEEIALLARSMVFAQYKMPEAIDMRELTNGLWLSSNIVDVFAWAVSTLTQRRHELLGRNALTPQKANFMDTDVVTKIWTSMYDVGMPAGLLENGKPKKLETAKLAANLDKALGNMNGEAFEFMNKKVHFLTGTLDDAKSRVDLDGDDSPKAYISAGLIGRNVLITPLILDVPGWMRHITLAFYDITEHTVYYYDSMQTKTCAKFWKNVLKALYQHRLSKYLAELRDVLGIQRAAMRFVDCISPLYLPMTSAAPSSAAAAVHKYGNLVAPPVHGASVHLKPAHQDGNGTECGVFACYYMWLFLTGKQYQPAPIAHHQPWIGNDANCTVNYMTGTFRKHMAKFFGDFEALYRAAERNVLA